MKLRALIPLALLACAVPAASQDQARQNESAQAQTDQAQNGPGRPGLGAIGTIDRGQYVCELPGDASGQVGLHQPAEDFRVASASRYRAADGDGTYLRRGDVLTMTSGPRNGAQYAVISPTFLRKIENGGPGRLRCFRRER